MIHDVAKQKMIHQLAANLGANLKRLRITKNLSYEQVAEKVELHWQTILRIENGDVKSLPRLKTMKRLADFFGTTPEGLFESPEDLPSQRLSIVSDSNVSEISMQKEIARLNDQLMKAMRELGAKELRETQLENEIKDLKAKLNAKDRN